MNRTIDAISYRQTGGSYKPGNSLIDWILQDAVGVYRNSTILYCIVRYFTLYPFRITVQFRFLQWMLMHGKCKMLMKLWMHRYNKRTAKINCNLSPVTKIGSGIVFPHGFPLVIHSHAVIGNNCIIHPGVQIGTSRTKDGAPVVGNNCFLGNGCHIIGNCRIGNWCFISPGAFVCKDIPDGSVVGFGINNIISDKGKENVLPYL